MSEYRNNSAKFIDTLYGQIDTNPHLFRFLTKELNQLDLGGLSSSEISSQINDLQIALQKAKRREEIIKVVSHIEDSEDEDVNFQVFVLPDCENKGDKIAFIGTYKEYSKYFLVPQEIANMEEFDD